MSKSLLEILPDLRQWANSAQGVLVLGSRASSFARVIDAAILAQRASSLFANAPGYRSEAQAGRLAFFIEGDSALEWASDVVTLIKEMREVLR